mmetsp:Transcript_17316/g.24225  ORF Transcript_17316/g.24225 Transcript_17316/m.24225 type:complete len:391 (+) Transcript_17316:212-1384(+)|eukprot:CAMPEP_0184490158 /NCGR_PEP_ID=MMETSP0113_2-20130426/17209_1 /TAXON_ID=91329 /ORGANISM="Norrisiella sphaerica, Strain BC52" /LENGTH=390 /DNA_ID=CAMNT_0026873917 /DNA_START=251 /DNA_END=1423 /DNA_ORIENTATION=-
MEKKKPTRETSSSDDDDEVAAYFDIYVDRKSSDSISHSEDNLSEKLKTEKVGDDHCLRCLQHIGGRGRCCVAHSISHRRDDGHVVDDRAITQKFFCYACKKNYSVIYRRARNGTFTRKMKGAEFCFRGRHTRKPIADDDRRRVISQEVNLHAGPELQQQIDDLALSNQSIQRLNIASDGYYDTKQKPISIEMKFPRLRHLTLIDIPVGNLKLNEVLTPNLEHLELKNIGNECDMEITLPKLRNACIHFWAGPSKVINDMLRVAVNLEVFETYKLWIDKLTFGSNVLHTIDLHRADKLRELLIWAPSLRTLNLQGCMKLDNIQFLRRHQLRRKLPLTFSNKNPLTVQMKHSRVSARAMDTLGKHPRFRLAEDHEAHPETQSAATLLADVGI